MITVIWLKTSAQILYRLDEELILSAEKCLVKVIAPKKLSNCQTFDDLRVKLHRQSMVNFKEVCWSAMVFSFIKALRKNIKRAYLQTKLWKEAPFGYVGDVLDISNNY